MTTQPVSSPESNGRVISAASFDDDVNVVVELIQDARLDVASHAPNRDHCREANMKTNDMLSRCDSSTLGLALQNQRIEVLPHSITTFLEDVTSHLRDPMIDPSMCTNHPIRIASENGHTDVGRLLLQDSQMDPSGYSHYWERRYGRGWLGLYT